jgi:hypothetical protein
MATDQSTAARRPHSGEGGHNWRLGRAAGEAPGSTPAAASVGERSRPKTHSDDAKSEGRERIVIELSSAQVDRVVRGAAEGGNMSVLLSGLKDVREVLAREPRQLDDSRLSRSLLAGLLMLASFPTDGSYLGNADIARILDMNPSTTHRYVSTLVAVGLLERDPSTRRYRLV